MGKYQSNAPINLHKFGFGRSKTYRSHSPVAYRSLKHPRGVIEDVLVKVNKFIFPIDFVVLDKEEDKEAHIILGRPFLVT